MLVDKKLMLADVQLSSDSKDFICNLSDPDLTQSSIL